MARDEASHAWRLVHLSCLDALHSCIAVDLPVLAILTIKLT